MSHIYNKNKKECEGCCVNNICTLEPLYKDPETNKTFKCPCIKCIVKVMCREGALSCKEYKKYYRYIYSHDKHDKVELGVYKQEYYKHEK